jgi:hypothetical protein
MIVKKNLVNFNTKLLFLKLIYIFFQIILPLNAASLENLEKFIGKEDISY